MNYYQFFKDELNKLKDEVVTPIPDIFHDTLIELKLMSDTK